MPGKNTQDSESTLTVVLALFANIGVGLLKLSAGLITGSSALLSEAAHSAGDSATEVLLLVAQRRSQKPADRSHPFGYGKARFFWSLLAAVAIFVSGSAFAFYEGLHTVIGGGESGAHLWINYPVLVFAAVLEGISLRQAAKQMRNETRRTRRTLRAYVLTPRDPTATSVLLEDTAAIAGIALALLGVGLHQLTGSYIYDGAASIAIGVLLLGVSFVLARACAELLIGRQADPQLLSAVEQFLEDREDVLDVVDVLTMVVGSDSVLLCARVDFVDRLNAADLEEACVRIDEQLRRRFEMLSEVFIQPASRRDAALRRRVEGRYGRALADD